MKKLIVLNCFLFIIAVASLFVEVLPELDTTFNVTAGLLLATVVIFSVVLIIGLIRNKMLSPNLRIGGFILSVSLFLIAAGGVFFAIAEEAFSEKPIKAYEISMPCSEVIYVYEYPPFMTSGAGEVKICKKGMVFPLRTTVGSAPSFEISDYFVRNDTLFITSVLANQQIVYKCGENLIHVNDSIQ